MNGGLDALAALCGNDSIGLSLPSQQGTTQAQAPDSSSSTNNINANKSNNNPNITHNTNPRTSLANHSVPNLLNPANFLSGLAGFNPQNPFPSSQGIWPGLNPQFVAAFAANQNQEVGNVIPQGAANLSNFLKSHGLDVGSAANTFNTIQQQQQHALLAASQAAVQQSQVAAAKAAQNAPQQIQMVSPLAQRPNLLNLSSLNPSASTGSSMNAPDSSHTKFDADSGNSSGKLVPLSASAGSVDPTPQEENPGDKKQLKRAANRRSAQLSRKRKKVFIEDLKEENDELRRKEQILKHIPDLIIVFEPTGKIFFVSHSVSNFLSYNPEELEGFSLWDRLSSGSVRLIKAAFMDALAARTPGVDMVPLGGVWDLDLVDKNGELKNVTLNGVVHFKGDSPECVCSIRSKKNVSEKESKKKTSGRKTADDIMEATVVSMQGSDADNSSSSYDD